MLLASPHVTDSLRLDKPVGMRKKLKKFVPVTHSDSRRDLIVFEEEETSLGISNFPQRIMEAAVLQNRLEKYHNNTQIET